MLRLDVLCVKENVSNPLKNTALFWQRYFHNSVKAHLDIRILIENVPCHGPQFSIVKLDSKLVSCNFRQLSRNLFIRYFGNHIARFRCVLSLASKTVFNTCNPHWSLITTILNGMHD